MSGPQNSEPTRPWSPPPEPQQPRREEKTVETPWWQQVRRRQPPRPTYPPPQPQTPPYQQAAPQAPYSPPPQYAQPPATPAVTAPPSRNTTRWLLIAGGVLVGAIVAVVLVLVLLGLNAFNRQELNVSKAQQDVKQVITDSVTGYGVENVTDVKCNDGKNPSANKGDTFTCSVTVDGQKREVRAVFIDDNGTYEVDRPR